MNAEVDATRQSASRRISHAGFGQCKLNRIEARNRQLPDFDIADAVGDLTVFGFNLVILCDYFHALRAGADWEANIGGGNYGCDYFARLYCCPLKVVSRDCDVIVSRIYRFDAICTGWSGGDLTGLARLDALG